MTNIKGTVGFPIIPVQVIRTGAGPFPTAFSVDPALPSGLEGPDTVNFHISGVPLETHNLTTHTVSGTRNGITQTYDIDIEIKSPITYTGRAIRYWGGSFVEGAAEHLKGFLEYKSDGGSFNIIAGTTGDSEPSGDIIIGNINSMPTAWTGDYVVPAVSNKTQRFQRKTINDNVSFVGTDDNRTAFAVYDHLIADWGVPGFLILDYDFPVNRPDTPFLATGWVKDFGDVVGNPLEGPDPDETVVVWLEQRDPDAQEFRSSSSVPLCVYDYTQFIGGSHNFRSATRGTNPLGDGSKYSDIQSCVEIQDYGGVSGGIHGGTILPSGFHTVYSGETDLGTVHVPWPMVADWEDGLGIKGTRWLPVRSGTFDLTFASGYEIRSDENISVFVNSTGQVQPRIAPNENTADNDFFIGEREVWGENSGGTDPPAVYCFTHNTMPKIFADWMWETRVKDDGDAGSLNNNVYFIAQGDLGSSPCSCSVCNPIHSSGGYIFKNGATGSGQWATEWIFCKRVYDDIHQRATDRWGSEIADQLIMGAYAYFNSKNPPSSIDPVMGTRKFVIRTTPISTCNFHPVNKLETEGEQERCSSYRTWRERLDQFYNLGFLNISWVYTMNAGSGVMYALPYMDHGFDTARYLWYSNGVGLRTQTGYTDGKSRTCGIHMMWGYLHGRVALRPWVPYTYWRDLWIDGVCGNGSSYIKEYCDILEYGRNHLSIHQDEFTSDDNRWSIWASGVVPTLLGLRDSGLAAVSGDDHKNKQIQHVTAGATEWVYRLNKGVETSYDGIGDYVESTHPNDGTQIVLKRNKGGDDLWTLDDAFRHYGDPFAMSAIAEISPEYNEEWIRHGCDYEGSKGIDNRCRRPARHGSYIEERTTGDLTAQFAGEHFQLRSLTYGGTGLLYVLGNRNEWGSNWPQRQNDKFYGGVSIHSGMATVDSLGRMISAHGANPVRIGELAGIGFNNGNLQALIFMEGSMGLDGSDPYVGLDISAKYMSQDSNTFDPVMYFSFPSGVTITNKTTGETAGFDYSVSGINVNVSSQGLAVTGYINDESDPDYDGSGDPPHLLTMAYDATGLVTEERDIISVRIKVV